MTGRKRGPRFIVYVDFCGTNTFSHGLFKANNMKRVRIQNSWKCKSWFHKQVPDYNHLLWPTPWFGSDPSFPCVEPLGHTALCRYFGHVAVSVLFFFPGQVCLALFLASGDSYLLPASFTDLKYMYGSVCVCVCVCVFPYPHITTYFIPVRFLICVSHIARSGCLYLTSSWNEEVNPEKS
jgi:hypothetical protein